jgi:hypothetical protein
MEQKNITQFQLGIIKRTYDKFCATGWPISINDNEMLELADATETDRTEVESQIRELMSWGLLQSGDSFSRHATWEIIGTYERNFPEPKVFKHNKIRRLLLQIAYAGRNEADGFIDSDAVYADVAAEGISHSIIYSNIDFLNSTGHVEARLQSGMGFYYRITDYDLATNPLKLAELYPVSLDDRVSLSIVGEVIQKWAPRQRRRLEEGYKAELAEYLRSHGYPKTREEEGASNADIFVDNVLPVEMKKNPDQSELDRISGQMHRMIDEFGQVIACIVQTGPGLDRIERFKKLWGTNDKAAVIVKSI